MLLKNLNAISLAVAKLCNAPAELQTVFINVWCNKQESLNLKRGPVSPFFILPKILLREFFVYVRKLCIKIIQIRGVEVRFY